MTGRESRTPVKGPRVEGDGVRAQRHRGEPFAPGEPVIGQLRQSVRQGHGGQAAVAEGPRPQRRAVLEGVRADLCHGRTQRDRVQRGTLIEERLGNLGDDIRQGNLRHGLAIIKGLFAEGGHRLRDDDALGILLRKRGQLGASVEGGGPDGRDLLPEGHGGEAVTVVEAVVRRG